MPHYVFVYPQIKRLTGAQRLILALAGAVAAQPNRVTLLTHRFAQECRPVLSPAVELNESGRNLNRTGNHYLDSLLEYGAVPGLLGAVPSDATAICFFGPPSLPGLWWAKKVRRLKIPLLYFCFEPPRAAYTDRQEVARRMGKLGWLLRPLLRLYRPLDAYLTRQADVVLVNGEYGQQLIRETYGLPATIITHGAELTLPPDLDAQVSHLRERYGLSDRSVILTVNHLHPRKRLDLLISTLPAVLAEHPEAALLIVGQGAEEGALRQLAHSLALSERQVIFAGFVAEPELAAHYVLATVYAHAGRAETFGLSVLEAGMAGLPVVATAEGGPLEILVEGETGFLIAPDPALFAQKINWLLAYPAQAQQMGQAGAHRAATRYTWEQGATAFVKAVAKVTQP